MEKLHIDIYPTTITSITIGIVANGAHQKNITLTPNVWNSFDIHLSDFTGVVSSDIIQFKFDGGTGKTFYLDNLYLYQEENTTGIKNYDHSNISIYPNPVQDEFVVTSSIKMEKATIYNVNGQEMKSYIVNATSKSLNASELRAGYYYVVIKYQDGASTA